MYLHNWMAKHWKPATAFVYTLIVICDFVIFPMWVGLHRVDLLDLMVAMGELDPEVQRDMIMIARKDYQPFTLKGGGLFHVSFGAILTTSAFKKEELSRDA